MPPRFAGRAGAVRHFLLVALIVLAAGARATAGPARGADTPVIAAAASLQFVLREIAAAFEAETGQAVRLSFGSSGNLARQIRQGAPFELFLSADETYVLDLARDRFTRDEGVVYAEGRLAIITRAGSPLVPDARLDGLRAALARGRITRFAIANPEHAPYGARAEEALRRAGLWEAVRERLVIGENVAQAAQFAVSADAEGGIVAYSQALAPRLKERARHALIPADWHAPLRQRMVRLNGAGPVAARFYAYVQSAPARAILARYGFGPSGEGT